MGKVAPIKVASRKGSTTSKGVRERWEQVPRKETGVENAGGELKVKKFEVKIRKSSEVQSEESKAKVGKREEIVAEDIIQLDGNTELNGSSDEDDELGDLDDDSDDEDSEGSDESSEDEGEDLGDALGSDDDISDEDASELFDTSNVVVCQYDRISKARNKWKFNLKNGVINLDGRDYTFLRATGEAVW